MASANDGATDVLAEYWSLDADLAEKHLEDIRNAENTSIHYFEIQATASKTFTETTLNELAALKATLVDIDKKSSGGEQRYLGDGGSHTQETPQGPP